MQTEEKAYWNKDISRILGIGESTVRKWCLELEKNGYKFNRGYKDSRAFLQHDINALTYFKDLTKVGSYTLEQAAILVVERYQDREVNDITVSVPEGEKRSLQAIEESMKKLVALTEEHVMMAKEQKEINKILLKKLDERDSLIESQFRYIERLNEEQAATKLLEIQHENDTQEIEEAKKKSVIERIKNLFKQ